LAIPDIEETVAGLRRWTARHDPHVRAAVELLINDGYWLGREDFREAATSTGPAETWIRWEEARRFRILGGSTASPTQKMMLDVAIALGNDEYRLSRANDEQALAILGAVAAALALKVEVISGG
jgi:hypothetical protein